MKFSSAAPNGGTFSIGIDSNCRAIGDSCGIALASNYPIAGGGRTRTSRCGRGDGGGSRTRSSFSGSGSGSGSRGGGCGSGGVSSCGGVTTALAFLAAAFLIFLFLLTLLRFAMVDGKLYVFFE